MSYASPGPMVRSPPHVADSALLNTFMADESDVVAKELF
jgi:hypothetical protein